MCKKLCVFILLILLLVPINIEAKNIEYNDSMPFIAEIDINNCNGGDDAILGDVSKPSSTAWLVQKILNYIRVLGPTIAVVLGSIDMVKAIITSDEENTKKAQSKFIKRLIAAVALFFVPLFVNILLGIFGFTTDSVSCGLK